MSNLKEANKWEAIGDDHIDTFNARGINKYLLAAIVAYAFSEADFVEANAAESAFRVHSKRQKVESKVLSKM